MKYIITESQTKKLQDSIQKFIDVTLFSLKNELEDWSDFPFQDEVESIEKIKIDRIVDIDRIKVYVDIYTESNIKDFDNTTSELEYRLKNWIPNIVFFTNEIIDTRTFGPGIDW